MKGPAQREALVILTAHGGLGDFLFQLDLAKRLEEVGIQSICLARSRYDLLLDMCCSSNVQHMHLVRADGVRYIGAVIGMVLRTFVRKVIIVNPFHATRFRFPTRMFYAIAHVAGARVLLCMHAQTPLDRYERLAYVAGEPIWQRNNRIVAYLAKEPIPSGFPVLTLAHDVSVPYTGYIHIHPVASLLARSYPPKKLLEVLALLGDRYPIVITMTPREAQWYLTDELRAYIQAHSNITLVSKQFRFSEIAGYIAQARVFCTVNTGLLWVACMLTKEVVVCDTYTDEEWNPGSYAGVTRLIHEYDDTGAPLHLTLRTYEDGTYFESLYRITPQEVAQTLLAHAAS